MLFFWGCPRDRSTNRFVFVENEPCETKRDIYTTGYVIKILREIVIWGKNGVDSQVATLVSAAVEQTTQGCQGRTGRGGTLTRYPWFTPTPRSQRFHSIVIQKKQQHQARNAHAQSARPARDARPAPPHLAALGDRGRDTRSR